MIDKHTLEILEYPKLLERIARSAASDPGKEEVLLLRPLGSLHEIEKRRDLISQIRRLTETEAPLVLDYFYDLRPLFSQLRPMNAVLKPLELRSLIPLLSNAETVVRTLEGRTDCQELREFVSEIAVHPEMRKSIERSIDPGGRILDTASNELASIRRKIKTSESRLRKKLQEMMKRPEIGKFIQEDFVTSRGGRWVIPFKRDAQGQVPGLVHDLSNSGETVFMEPLETLWLGNELGALAAAERAEEARIITDLCRRCREVLPEIELSFQILVRLDALTAISAYADRLKMTPPRISEGLALKITGGRHPLLWTLMIEEGLEEGPVPLEISLNGNDTRAVVITGPNTGGKTVALKTAGLLCLMAMSGMHVPAEDGSGFPFLETIAADIGDEQSIEQSLSTFSGHMTRISKLLSQSGPNSLILMDELGGGTDPEEGGPLACSILKAAVDKGGLVLVSTHLGAVKNFVHSMPHMINAAAKFDYETLTPTYQLEIGIPGSSHAIEIAARYGIPEDVVNEAKRMMPEGAGDIQALVSELEGLRETANRKLAGAEESLKYADKIKEDLKKQAEEIKKRQKSTLHKATVEALNIVRNSRVEMDRLLKEIRSLKTGTAEAGIAKDTISIARAAAAAMDDRISRLKAREEELSQEDFRPVPPADIRVGERYFVKSLGCDALLIKLNRKTGRCRVSAGQVEVEVDISALGVLEDSTAKAGPEPAAGVRFEGEIPEEASQQINLVGQRVEPALAMLDRFIDQAALAGLSELRIIHGLGSGILCRAVREFLSAHPMPLTIRPGKPSEGGGGVTVVFIGEKEESKKPFNASL